MHTHTNPHRSYRDFSTRESETVFQVVVEETDLCIVCSKDLTEEISRYVHTLRGQIKTYMELHPAFTTALTPLPTDPHAPPLVAAMLESTARMGVGPMAAVAGVMAQAVADRFKEQSADILVENGGDIFMHSTRSRTIGILPDPAGGMALGLSFAKEDFPCAICASSAVIGHSLSLGRGDLVVVRGTTGGIADAAATRLCNELRTRKDIKKVLGMAEDFKKDGIQGVLAQCEGNIGIQGSMELVALTP